MIELTPEQRLALNCQEFARALDPDTGQVYVLIQADHYEKIRRLLDGASQRAGWDEPEMDEYDRYRKKTL